MIDLNSERVEVVMRRVVGVQTARLEEWRSEPVAYLSVLPGRSLLRVSGTATDGIRRGVPWSCVVKIIRAPRPPATLAYDSGSREIQAYRSSLLDDLPGPLRAPRLFRIDEDDVGGTWLWLEELHDIYDRRWPIEQFAVAARHLGIFNAASVMSRSLPKVTWLNPWLHNHWAEVRREIERIPDYAAFLQQLARESPVQHRFGKTFGPTLIRLLNQQPAFVEVLAKLPQTLCHHDAALANLFAQRRADGAMETVAVDWEKIGPGAIGAEIATLVFGTLRRCEFDARRADELDSVVFDAYVEGLREAGWTGPREQVRLGYTAAVALRCMVLVDIVRSLLEPAAGPVRTSYGTFFRPEQVLEQRVRLSQFLLKRADEAHFLVTSSSAPC